MAKQISATLKKVLEQEVEIPQVENLVSAFFKVSGGTKTIARLLKDEFDAAKPGSQIRQRILDMILRAAKFSQDRLAKVDDLGILSDDDLERRALEMLSKMNDHGSTGPAGNTPPQATYPETEGGGCI